MHDDVVLFTAADGLTAFAAEDGNPLWTGPRLSGPGISHPPDLFIADGLVNSLGVWGPLALMVGIFLLTTSFSQVINNTATAVLILEIPYRFLPIFQR